MREENSAGGVVFFQGRVLLLRKKRGYWVLPKGRIEPGEAMETATLREVQEESGVQGEIVRYIGEINYSYKNQWTGYEWVIKRVCWYLMTARNGRCTPQLEEGFSSARFVSGEEAVRLLRYDDERKILMEALEMAGTGLKPATPCRD